MAEVGGTSPSVPGVASGINILPSVKIRRGGTYTIVILGGKIRKHM